MHFLTLDACTGDVNNITVGTNTNIQDAAIVHVARHALGDPTATVIGNNVTIGGPTTCMIGIRSYFANRNAHHLIFGRWSRVAGVNIWQHRILSSNLRLECPECMA